MSREESQEEFADDERDPSLRDVLQAMGNMDSPGVTATDIGVILGCSPDTARRRLRELADAGRVEHRSTGQQTLWWDLEDERHEEYGVVAETKPVDMGETDAVELVESGEEGT